MKMKKIIFNGILFMVMFPLIVSASSINVEIDIKESFNLGETISFDYTLITDNSAQITYFDYIICPNALREGPEQKNVFLDDGEQIKKTHSEFVVDDSIEPQTCTAYVQILSPFEQTFSKDFKITTNPSFSFETKICKDSECSERTKVFVKGESIFLDYSSSVESLSITAVLTYPDKTTKQLTLPTSIKAEQTGNYQMEVTASKQGYKTINKKQDFGVIHGDVVIEPKEFKGDKNVLYSLYALTIILIIALFYITIKIGGIPALGIRTSKSEVTRINNKINNAKRLIRQGNINTATSEYLEITKLYDKLTPEKKKIVYRNLHDLYIRIK